MTEKGRGSGLSLAELIASFGLVSVVSLAIIGVFSGLMLGSSKNSTQAAAELLARTVLDSAARSDPETWPSLSSFQKKELIGDRGSKTTELFCRLESELIDQHQMGDLHRLQVSVTWDSSDPEGHRLGRGKNWIELGRIVYVEKSI